MSAAAQAWRPGWRRSRAEGGRFVFPFVFLAAFAGLSAMVLAGMQSGAAGKSEEDWSASPEAYFLTSEERGEWRKIDSRDSRHQFVERYWLKRDPTAGTEKNEFREMVLARIKTADARFKIENTPGSRTARGLVFIVLGSPARVQDQLAPRPPAESSSSQRLGQRATPVAMVEGNETTSTWTYEPDRTPRILEVIHRSILEIKIVVEPSRHLDAVQNPGLFDEVREIVARASIVNPDLVPPPAAGGSPQPAPAPLPHQPLAAAVRQLLETAPAVSRSDGAIVSSAVLFRNTGDAEVLLWVFTPRPTKQPFFHALIRGADGSEMATLTEPAEISNAFSTRAPGMVTLRRLSLPPGSYLASVALTDGAGKPLGAAELPLQVPALEAFAVSSLIITRGPAAVGAGANGVFTFAGTALPPRADGAFASSESLWYFVEVANPTDAQKVMLEPRLRRGGEPLAGLPPFPASLQPIGSGRYLAGVELPLATLGRGDYVIYLTVSDGEADGRPKALRRADFHVLP